jgi:hypothetical protein
MSTTNTCLNCGSPISCGCQRRVASDGKKVCNNCIQLYEKMLKDSAQQKTKKNE